jgi:uncharacterized membrane protein
MGNRNVMGVLRSLLGTWIAGLLALLPLVLTLLLLAWMAKLVHVYLGPGSPLGRFFVLLGQPFVAHPALEYFAGFLLLLLVVYPLGLLVQSRLQKPLGRFVEASIRRIPLVGSLYALADRFVGLLDQRQGGDISAMRPVWCFFGEGSVAVLALLPNPAPIDIEGSPYLAVLVPTAPVPIGGGLLYVPVDRVRPARIGVEQVTSIYLSMGMVQPETRTEA